MSKKIIINKDSYIIVDPPDDDIVVGSDQDTINVFQNSKGEVVSERIYADGISHKTSGNASGNNLKLLEKEIKKVENNTNLKKNTTNLSDIKKLYKNAGELDETTNMISTSLKDFRDHGLLLMYVPKDPNHLYATKSATNTKVVPSKPRTDIRQNLNTFANGNNARDRFNLQFDVAQSDNIDNAFVDKNNKTANASKPKNAIDKVDLFCEFTQFSLPEVLKIGKEAQGGTTNIPGGSRQTQITGVYASAFQLEVVLYDLYAQETMALLELFTGKRTVIFYQETGTKLNFVNKTTGQGEEVKSYAWLGTVMKVEFDYYHRHYIVARIHYEPTKDIRVARINTDNNQKEISFLTEQTNQFKFLAQQMVVDDKNAIPCETGLNSKAITDYISKIKENPDLQKFDPDKYYESVLELERSLTKAWNATSVAQSIAIYDAKYIKDLIAKVSAANPTFDFLDPVLKWLDENFINYIKQANDFVQQCLNYENKLVNLLSDGLGIIDRVLNPLEDITNNLFYGIKRAGGLLDVLLTPLKILEKLKTKFNNAKRGFLETKASLESKFQDIYFGYSSAFTQGDPNSNKSIKEGDLKALINTLNNARNVPFVPAYTEAQFASKVKNMSENNINSLEYLQMKKVQDTLLSSLIPDATKQAILDEAERKEKDIQNKEHLALEKQAGTKLTLEEAQLLKVRNILTNTTSNLKPIDAVFQKLVESLIIKETPSPQIIKPMEEIAYRQKIISSMLGTVSNKAEETYMLRMSDFLKTATKQIPLENNTIQTYNITADDIIKGGYPYIANNFYGRATLGNKLEKYNGNAKLELGVSIKIPTLAVLLVFDLI